MSISLSGNNVFQIGKETIQLAITRDGALLPTGSSPGLNFTTARKNLAIDSLISSTYNNLVQDSFATHMKNSFDAQQAFKAVYDAVDMSVVPASVITDLNDSNLGRQLLDL